MKHPTDTPNHTRAASVLFKPSSSLIRMCGVALAQALLCFSPAFAQTASDADAAKSAKGEEIIELSPFVVDATKDVGYQAASTLAGTRLNTDLKDVGAAVSVYTAEFLNDINANRIEDILTYTASTEGGGVNGNYSGVGGATTPGDETSANGQARTDPSSVNRVRGLAAATRTRDFFVTDIPSDGFSFDTLTINRGPNAILAGIGSGGGVIDTALRKAIFKDEYRVVSQVSEHGTHREEIHLNKVILPKRLALRLDLLNEDQYYRQKPAYSQDQRLYAAMNYRMIEGSRSGVLGQGTVRANFETGKVEGTPPDSLPPSVAFDSWFYDSLGNPLPADLLHWGWNGSTGKFLKSNGTTVYANPTSKTVPARLVPGFPLFRNWGIVYADQTSNVPTVGLTDPSLSNIQGFIGATGSGGTGLRATGDLSQGTGYVRTRLQNPEVFDYYRKLLTGVLDFRQQDFDALDLRYEQLFFGGKAGLEGAYNLQHFTSARNLPILNGAEPDIYIDVNRVLSVNSPSFPSGIPNPNFGRPFIHTQDAFSDQSSTTNRESYQMTGFFRQDFAKSRSKFLQKLGDHTLTALAFKTNINKSGRTYSSTWDPTGQLNSVNSLNASPGAASTRVNAWYYLGASQIGATSPDEIRFEPISTGLPQYGETYTLRVTQSGSSTTGTTTPLRIVKVATEEKETVKSYALALQSRLFSDHVVTMLGWRYDGDDTSRSATPATLPNGGLDVSNLTLVPAFSTIERTWTKSIVGLLPVKFPGDTEIRGFWNTSSNYNPVGARRNIWNEDVGSPTAVTTERGISLTAFNGKFSLRINQYKTSVKNDQIGASSSAWSRINAFIQRMIDAKNNSVDITDPKWGLQSFSSFSDVALALFDTIPQGLRNNMGADKSFYPHFTGSGSTLEWVPDPNFNPISLGDTVSYGMEYEAIINPTKNWRISISAAQNQGAISGAAAQELAFAEEWHQNLINGGLINGARNPGTDYPPSSAQTMWQEYNQEALPAYRALAAKSGTATPEIRKWRVNFVTNYSFRRGFLKGFTIGGAVRWQDRVAIGYPLIPNADGNLVSDVANPYWGPTDLAVDASCSYTRKIKFGGTPITWRIGLNCRNLNADDTLIPIRANPDGTVGTLRIPPERMFSLTNSFTF